MKNIEVIYLGEEVHYLGVAKVFRDAKGERYSFKGVKGVWFGESYFVSDKGTIKTRPERVEKQTLKVTEEEVLKYEANKIAVKEFRLTKQKEMILKRPHKDILKAIELLKPFARQMDHFNVNRFFNYIKNETTKKTKEEIKCHYYHN